MIKAALALLMIFMLVGSGCRSHSNTASESGPTLEAITSAPPSHYWRMVANSDLIIRTRMEFPGKRLSKLGRMEVTDYSEVTLPVLEVLKEAPGLPSSHSISKIGRGNWLGRVVRLPVYTGEMAPGYLEHSPLGLCQQFNGRDVLVFLWLCNEGSAYWKGFSLTESKDVMCIQAWSEDLAKQIRSEVNHQSQAIELVRRYLGTHTVPLEARVNETISKFMNKNTLRDPARDKLAEEIFQGRHPRGNFRMTYPAPLAELEELGMDAVPAIIKVLDDRRELPEGGISVGLDIHDHPYAFEGIYHTGASSMVQVLDMALGQIVLDGVPGPFPGREYQDRAAGFWRIWFLNSGMLGGIKAGKSPSESVPKPKSLGPNAPELPAVRGSVGIL